MDAATVRRMAPLLLRLDQSGKDARAPMVSLAPHSTETLGGGNLMTP